MIAEAWGAAYTVLTAIIALIMTIGVVSATIFFVLWAVYCLSRWRNAR